MISHQNTPREATSIPPSSPFLHSLSFDLYNSAPSRPAVSPSEPLRRLSRHGETPRPLAVITPVLASTTPWLGAGPTPTPTPVAADHHRRRRGEPGVRVRVPLEAPLTLGHDLGLGDHEPAALERVHASADVRIVPIVVVVGPPPTLPLGRRRVGRARARRGRGRGRGRATLPVRVHDDELQAGAVIARVARIRVPRAARPARGREGRAQLEVVVVVVVTREPAVVARDVHLLRHKNCVPAVRQHRPEDGHRRHDGRQVHLESREDDALRPVEGRVYDGVGACSVLDYGV